MKKTILALMAFVLAIALPTMLFAADAKTDPKPAVIETYRTNAGFHIFTIHGKDWSVPITAEFDFATAQSAARNVANGGGTVSSSPQTPPLETPCANGRCPIPPKRH